MRRDEVINWIITNMGPGDLENFLLDLSTRLVDVVTEIHTSDYLTHEDVQSFAEHLADYLTD